MTKTFSALKVGATIYGPLLLVGCLLLLFALRGQRWAFVPAIPILVLGLFSLYFFRDPERTITAAPNEAVSPADGTVVAIEDLAQSPYYPGPCRRISIFLSVFNVHVNRAPFDGVVKDIHYRAGSFKDARLAETSDCNEANTVRMETSVGVMVVRQISGLIARRIVCEVPLEGKLAKGEKFGMIRFGSRTELYLAPAGQVCVGVGDKVAAGSTVVARFL